MEQREEAERRSRIVKEAKSWIGSRYRDFAGLKAGPKTGRGGVDCAFYPLRVFQATGFIDPKYKPEWYSPEKWVNHPSQTRFHVEFEDTTMLDDIKRHFKREILPPEEPQAGDLMLCMVHHSWSHAAIIISWPDLVLHPVKKLGVIGSHALNGGFWQNTPKRFFSMFEKEE